MSVFQVEEFYIFISIGSVLITDELKVKIEGYMSENSLDDFEWQGDSLVIDGLTDESQAECHDRDIKQLIERYFD